MTLRRCRLRLPGVQGLPIARNGGPLPHVQLLFLAARASSICYGCSTYSAGYILDAWAHPPDRSPSGYRLLLAVHAKINN